MEDQSVKEIMNRIEKIIGGLNDDLKNKRDRYLIEYEQGGSKWSEIISREKYLEFVIGWAQDQLESLSGDIYDETGIDTDVV